MGQSLILLIEELAQGMTEAFAAVNDGFAALEQSWNMPLDFDVSDTDVFPDPATYELAEIDLVRYMVFNFANLSENLTLTIPSLTNGNPTRRLIIITNASEEFTITVQTDDTGETVLLSPLSAAMLHIVEVDVRPILLKVASIFNIGGYVSGAPANALEILRSAFTDSVSFPINWATPGVGAITFTAQPDDTDTVIVNDGVVEVTFEFESGGGVTGGNTAVTIGGSFDATAANLAAAINAATGLNVLADYDATGNVCLVYNFNGAGGELSATSASPDFSVVDFEGGINGARGSVGIVPTANTFLSINKIVGATTEEVGTIRIRPNGTFFFRSGTREEGSVLFNANTDDGDTLTIFDGIATVRFEFDSNAAVTAGNIAVTIAGSIAGTAQNLTDAIMASHLNVEAIFDAVNTVDLLNGNCDSGAITKSDGDNDMTVTDFTGGAVGTAVTFDPGEVMTVVNQATADATAANIAFTLTGLRG